MMKFSRLFQNADGHVGILDVRQVLVFSNTNRHIGFIKTEIETEYLEYSQPLSLSLDAI